MGKFAARIFGERGAPAAPAAVPPGGTQTSAPAPPPQTAGAAPAAGVDALDTEARAHYDRAIAAQRAGDWAKYGEEIRALGAALEQMRRR